MDPFVFINLSKLIRVPPVPLSGTASYSNYGTFKPIDTAVNNILTDKTDRDQPIIKAIDEVFKAGSPEDKKTLSAHLHRCSQNQNLPLVIRDKYSAIWKNNVDACSD